MDSIAASVFTPNSQFHDSVRVKIMFSIMKTLICTFAPVPQLHFQVVAYISLWTQETICPTSSNWLNILCPRDLSISHSQTRLAQMHKLADVNERDFLEEGSAGPQAVGDQRPVFRCLGTLSRSMTLRLGNGTSEQECFTCSLCESWCRYFSCCWFLNSF